MGATGQGETASPETSLMAGALLQGMPINVSETQGISSHAGTVDGLRQANDDAEAKLLTRLTDIWHIAVAGGARIGLAQYLHGLVWRQDVAHQMGEGGDTDHLIGAHVVGLAWAAVLQQGEEPMGQVALVEVGAQGGAVAGDGDGIGGEGIADEVADGVLHIERQIRAHKGKAAGHHSLQAMLLGKQGAEVFGSALGLAVGRAGLGQRRTAWPVFRNGAEISGLGSVDSARAGEQKAAGACGHGKIEDVPSALHNLVVALQRREAGADGGISSRVQHMGEVVAPGERVALLDAALQKRD